MIFDEKLGVWHEPGTNQIETFKDLAIELAAYKHIDFKDKIVLDIGACAGSFSRLALEGGAKHVIAIEPHPTNIAVYKKNVPSAIIFEAAVVPDYCEDTEITFYTAPSGNLTISSTAAPGRISSRDTMTVATVKFSDLLDKYKPQVIKMDIEGAEFDILQGPLPDYVEEFTAEFHIFRRKDRILKWWNEICWEWFGPSVWRVVKKPEWADGDRCMSNFQGLNVHTMGWKRKGPNSLVEGTIKPGLIDF
jgi:FkbM family methyltransferase